MKASVTKALGAGFSVQDVELAAPIGQEVRIGEGVRPVPLRPERRHLEVQGVYMGSSNLKRDIPLYASLYLQSRMNLDDLVSKEIAPDEIERGYEALKDGKTARVVVTDLG